MSFIETFAQIARAVKRVPHWSQVSIEQESWVIRGVLESGGNRCPLAAIALVPNSRLQLQVITNLRVPGLRRRGPLDPLLAVQSGWSWTRAFPDRIADSVTLMTAVPCCEACGAVDNGFLEASLDDHRAALCDRDFWATVGGA